MIRHWSRGILACLLLMNSLPAADSPVDYLKEVKPLLMAKCSRCHNEAESEGKLRLDSAPAVLRGGERGPAIVPGKSAESLLIQAVRQTGDLKMPPEGAALTAAQIETIRRWIDEGAKAPADETRIAHWAFQTPARPGVPEPRHLAWRKNPVDAFIAAKHDERGLHPVAAASKPVWLRRVFLDLIGLPPTPEQLDAYLKDDSPTAEEKIVDELLASQHYGERWGRHWMDVWRYSDWDGYAAEVRESKPHIWRWRDWIIESLNADKPYDRMIQEMLAGDELAPGDPATLRATGFLVRNWYVFNRNVWLDAIVEHTGKAFLGVTFNCARCHDHMYDPMPQAEYYQLRAFFETHDIRTDRVPGQPDPTKEGLVRVFDNDANAPTFLFVRGDEKNPLKDKPIAPGLPKFLHANSATPLAIAPVTLSPRESYPGLQKFIVDETLAAARGELTKADAALDAARKSLAMAKQRLEEHQSRAATISAAKPFLLDDFSKANADQWQMSSGQWRYENGRLLQLDPADSFCSMKSVRPHPRDFTAKLTFRATGGDVYRSVGLSFDLDDADKNFSFVYASSGGGKLQIARRINGADQYPPTGAKALAIELNQTHELVVTVRGETAEVTWNGQPTLKLAIPNRPTEAGRFAIWTYDGIAEFHRLEITDATVADEATLQAAVKQAERSFAIAEKSQVVAAAAVESVEARVAADQANYANPIAANAQELSLVAGRAERQHAVRQAELALLNAEQKLAAAQESLKPGDAKLQQAVTAADQALVAAKKSFEAAQMAATQPHEKYARLTPTYPSISTGRRLAFARWITQPDHPLTARVAINHIWLRHFQQPLVSTVFDFGLNGKSPTHPELLDWLATELVANGWRMKPIHKRIVLSQAYRMASAPLPAQAQLDPENQLLWRQNARRMEAEIVRDATLFVSGQLDSVMGGPDLDPNAGLTLTRRSVYFRSSKEKKMTFLALFDSANPVDCYRRSESIAPQQSLAMSNSPLTLAQSRLLAKKLSERFGPANDPRTNTPFIDAAFVRILSRSATAEERSECAAFLSQQSQRLAAAKELTTFAGQAVSAVKPATDPAQRARENLIHVLLNHNDFVTIR